jgi:hypothetical protein
VTVATIDLAKIKADKSVEKEVIEAYTYLKIYMDQKERQEWLKRRESAWKAIENKMWSRKEEAEMAEAGQVPLVINKCNKGVQGSCAIVTDQRPEIKFYPVGASDLYVAELLKRAHDLVWVKNSGNDVTYDVVEESKIGGIGFFEAYHDPSKGLYGRIVMGDEPPDDIYWDKDSRARDLSDTHIIKAKMRTKSYILENYDDVKEKDLHFEQSIKGDSGVSSGLTGKDNYKEQSDQTPDSQGAIYQEPENIWEIEAWMLRKVKEHWLIRTNEQTGMPEPVKMEFKKEPSRKEGGRGGSCQRER